MKYTAILLALLFSLTAYAQEFKAPSADQIAATAKQARTLAKTDADVAEFASWLDLNWDMANPGKPEFHDKFLGCVAFNVGISTLQLIRFRAANEGSPINVPAAEGYNEWIHDPNNKTALEAAQAFWARIHRDAVECDKLVLGT
jgi:hypothetical protein